jgi:adenylate cyclase
MTQVQRKLTTILAADAAGYAAVMEADEVRTLEALRVSMAIFRQFIERHHGRIANTAGDALIAEFPSVVEAVQCAIEVQRELSADGAKGLRFRIGIHLGDVLVDGDDLLGEGVNLAARLESMADPGAILISQQVYDQVQKKLSVGFAYLGEKRPKNFEESVAVYSVGANQSDPAKPKPTRAGRRTGAPVLDKRSRFLKSAFRLGVIWLALLGVNIFSGPPYWVQWPALGMVLYLALRSGPLFERSE